MAANWRESADVPLPEITREKRDVKIVESSTNISGPWGTLKVFYLEASPVNSAPKRNTSVLFLHGMSFTSATWRELGTIHILCALGFHVIAIDLPGFGRSQNQMIIGDVAGQFLGQFMSQVNLEKPVVVSPSMSGTFILPYIFQASSSPSIKGYIPVAPVGTGSYTVEQYRKHQFPVLIVYGQNDRSHGEISLKHLSGFQNKKVVCIEDAGHACYMNKPDKWHESLYNFLINID